MEFPDVDCIALIEPVDFKQAAEARKPGAQTFLRKPLDPERLKAQLQNRL